MNRKQKRYANCIISEMCVCVGNHDPNALRQWLQWPLVLIVILRYCVLIPFLFELKIIWFVQRQNECTIHSDNVVNEKCIKICGSTKKMLRRDESHNTMAVCGWLFISYCQWFSVAINSVHLVPFTVRRCPPPKFYFGFCCAALFSRDFNVWGLQARLNSCNLPAIWIAFENS